MAGRFDAFVLFAEMRTGSNYLEATLNEVEGLSCLGEVYNPTFMGHHKTFDMHGIDMDAREADPLRLFDAILEKTEGLPGFRFFNDHDPRVLERVLPDPRIAKVILTRNPLDSYVSRKIASATGQWRLTDVKHRRETQKITFDQAEFEELIERLQGFQQRLQRGLQETGQTAFYIRYEDINDVDVINGIVRFLGVEGEVSKTSSKLKPQNPGDLSEKVENYDEMVAAVSSMDRFDLSRTPNFEPRRHAGVPGFYATPETGLLFMPIKGGLTDAVLAWMAGLDGITRQDLNAGMSQKELRQWMRHHPGYRSFTIVRHPVVRAYDTFNSYIVQGGRPAYEDARRALRNRYKIPFPAKGFSDKAYGPEEHKAAFLAFLEFLKANLAAQTSLKVDPAWATQSAILQGMANVTLPDQVIREEEMAEALPRLAAVVGTPDAEFEAEPDAPPFPLKRIYDGSIESAAMDVYRRDYLNFGYPRWNKL